MAYSISSEDMLAIGLILSDYDTSFSIDKVFQRVESYQQSQSDYFGETDNDFKRVFIHLGVELEWFGWGDVIEDSAATLAHIPLRKWMTTLLEHYDYAWFKDTDEGWWTQFDENGKPKSIERKKMMLDFLKNPENDSPQKIRHFLADRLGWKKEYIQEFLTHVDSDRYTEDHLVFADDDGVLRLRLPEQRNIR